MGVRFFIGRAGTGKSAKCAAQIREAAGGDPLGGALLWITPEQSTFTAERMLLTGGELHGTFRAQVLSFRRLALLIARQLRLIGNSVTGKNARPMDDLARLVLLQEMVGRQKDRLQIFSAVADRPGFVEKLDGTLRELRQHEQSGASLRQFAAGPNVDPVSARKLHDLAILLDAWQEVVEDAQAWDFEKVMHQAATEAGRAPLITEGGGAQVWVDGFSALSALEIQLLMALGRHAADVTITLEADPDSSALKEARGSLFESVDGGVFARTERLHRRLLDAFRAGHVDIVGTEFLRTPHRFQVPALRKLEAELFSDAGESPPPGKKKPAGKAAAGLFENLAASEEEGSAAAIEIWECSDPETEARAAAQAIRDMVTRAENPFRYRQIGLIVPDLEGYQDALRRIFTEHNIPHFIDQRRSIAHHPLVELLRSAVAIASNRWDQDELLLYLKTGLAGVAEADVSLVENYVLAHGIDHVPWSVYWRWIAPNQKEEDDAEIPENTRELLRRVNAVRQKVWNDLHGWMALAEQKQPVMAAEYVRGLQQLLLGLKVESQIEKWVEGARVSKQAGDVELAQIHEQAWRQVQELLGMLEQLLAERPRTLEEFEHLLAAALQTLTLGLIPPTVDQVLISSVTRSRVPELKVAFVLGVVEGQFPKVLQEDPILSDVQRDIINASATFPINGSSDRQLLEMPFFDYVAFTRASERLIVTYPLADRQGRAVVKSRYVGRLRDLFRADANGILERKLDGGSRTAVERIGTLDDLLTGVVTWTRDILRRRAETLQADASRISEFPAMEALYNWLVTAPDLVTQQARKLVWSCIEDRPAPQLSLELAHRFYPPEKSLRISVSQLEKFAGCPLQYFMHYTLGLRPRAMLELDTLHLGVLYHAILERIYQQIIDGVIPWPECDAFTLRKALEKEVDAACEQLHEELAERTPAYDQMRERTKRTMGIVLESQRRRACQGDLRPTGVEVNFGGSRQRADEPPRAVTLPQLKIKTPLGREVELNGKIDRVDTSDSGKGKDVAVIDYKSASKKTLELYWVYYGLALQLPVYAVVMQELAKRNPVAAMYVPLGITRKTVKRPTAETPSPGPDSDEFHQKNPPRGVVSESGAAHLDHAVGPHEDEGAKSDWYKIGYNKNGDVPKSGDMITDEDFTILLGYVRWKIGTMTDSLMQGQIAPLPYRDKKQIPCDDCDFASLCPFDKVSGSFRAVPKMKRDEALAAMRADMNSATNPIETVAT